MYIYACIYVHMCLCNDDLAHVINQSAILSLPLFFFYISLAHGLSRSPDDFHDLNIYSFSLFLSLSSSLAFISFHSILLFGTHKMENNYTYISRAFMHLCDSINFECAILSFHIFVRDGTFVPSKLQKFRINWIWNFCYFYNLKFLKIIILKLIY